MRLKGKKPLIVRMAWVPSQDAVKRLSRVYQLLLTNHHSIEEINKKPIGSNDIGARGEGT